MAVRWCFWLGLVLVAGGASLKAREPLVIFAASSLTDALTVAAERYSRAEVVLSFAASSVLARQITYGALADIYISADQLWMDRLDRYLDTQVVLFGNQLVWIVPAGAMAPGWPDSLPADGDLPDINPLDWLGHSYLAVGDPTHVPAGRYARAALVALGWWGEVETRLIAAGNTRLALAYVARAEVPLGIVYRSDAQLEPRVRVLMEIPSQEPICYPGAVVATSKHIEAASFLAFLQTPEMQELFQQMGFIPRASGCQ